MCNSLFLACLALECAVALRLATTVVEPAPQTCVFHRTFDRLQQDADFGINADPDITMEMCTHSDVEDVYYHRCVADLNESRRNDLNIELPFCSGEVGVHYACKKTGAPDRARLTSTCDPVVALQKSNEYGCCNGEFDDNCQATTCTCAKQAFVYKDLPNNSVRPQYVSSLLANAKMQKLLFIGDSTTRRLFYAFCAYFGGNVFWDRHGGYHGDIACPEDGFSDQGVADANLTLRFKWSPTLEELAVRRKFEADIIITSNYHWDRLYNAGQIRTFPQRLVDWGTSVASEHPHAHIVLVGANLLSGAHKQQINKDIIDCFEQINAIAPSRHRLITVDNQWVQSELGSAFRDPCLGDTDGTSIHIRFGVGQFLRMHHVLAAIIGV